MAVAGFQEFWVVGARVYIQRDDISSIEQPLLDLGVITEIDPSIETESAVLNDTDGGALRKVDEVETKREEMYNATIANFNPDNLNILYGGDAVQSFTQAATPLTSIAHYAHPGRLVKLKSAAGVWMYGITSIEQVTVTGGSPVLVEDTDWEVVDLERGLIRMISGGAHAAAADVDIDFTPRAIAASNRLILPQVGKGSIKAKVGLVLSSCDNEQQRVREMYCSIQTDDINLPLADEHSNWVARFSVLQDFTTATQPFGRLLHWLGDVPALS